MSGLLVAFVIVAGLLVVILMLAMAGMIYQAIGLRRDARFYPPSGKLIDVGGYRLHLSSEGEGSPTVVMDSGLGHTSLVWSLVQPEVAHFTRVCVYDRAGYAWSDLGTLPRTSRQVVQELHTLLTRAEIQRPYVLVGHSFGGLNMTLYASLYPDEVSGLVLVDYLSKDILTENPWALQQFIAWNRFKFRALSTIARLGIFRVFLRVRGVEAAFDFARLLPNDLRPMLAASVLRKTFAAAAAETASLVESIEEVRTAPPLQDIPLIVLSHSIPDMFTSTMSAIDAQRAEGIWQHMQSKATNLTPSGMMVVAEKSGHKIHLDQPEAVIAAIRQVVEAARH